MTITMAEGMIGKTPWRQYMLITDGCVAIVDMIPKMDGRGEKRTLVGWGFGKVTIQGDAEWPDMTEAQILAWKERAYPGHEKVLKDVPRLEQALRIHVAEYE